MVPCASFPVRPWRQWRFQARKALPDDVCLSPAGNLLLALSSATGEIVAFADQVPGQEVDETPLAVKPTIAFPDLKWEGWQPENDRGQLVALRPILLTHANDGSNRNFVATEQGVIHVFPNDQKATKTQVFLDIQSKVKYDDRTNEEGFLGLAFHPNYKTNGEFFVFYTLKQPRLTNVVCRYRVSKDDPNKADPNSEEEILRITRPFWNHDGGTLCFGPDGFLYIALGDGGLANDPNNNGQNTNVILGKILRIDVNTKEGDKKYGIPKDNPFAGKPDARGEIFAYGLRNVWRMSFDRKTGWLWAADVGQNLYEEIDIIVKGGNYGWRKREGLHPFSTTGVTANDAMIDPIWEYHHDVGKSLTGGNIYRGKLLPELDGLYFSADYVSGKIWGLKYDETKKRVVANHPIPTPPIAVMSFGEDQEGEVYFMTYSTSGKGIYRLERTVPAAATATENCAVKARFVSRKEDRAMRKVAIIGGGFSGTVTAINLVRLSRAALDVVVINNGFPLGRGIAYSTRQAEHLLNVVARNMSALADQPSHFVEWLRTRHEYADMPEAQLREQFIPRRIYGDYLQSVLFWHAKAADSKALGGIERLTAEAVDITLNGSEATITLDGDRHLKADKVVLATGNNPPGEMGSGSVPVGHAGFINNPWQTWDYQPQNNGENAILLGTGLTMIDAYLTLKHGGWRGPIVAISRNGLIPHAHFKGIEYHDFPPEDVATFGLEKLATLMEAHCGRLQKAGNNPAIVIDKLRPFTQRIWDHFSVAEKQEFSRKYRSVWGVYRHRIAESIHRQLTDGIENGQLQVVKGKIASINGEGAR